MLSLFNLRYIFLIVETGRGAKITYKDDTHITFMSRWVFCGKTHINESLTINIPRDAILTPSFEAVMELLKCKEPRRCKPQFNDYNECSLALGVIFV